MKIFYFLITSALVFSLLQAGDVTSLLSQQTDVIMTTGGDDRLHLDSKTGLSKYFTAPRPCRDVIIRSSCTSSLPTEYGFKCAQAVHNMLLQAHADKNIEQVFDQLTRSVRKGLMQFFALKDLDPFVILSPSGTDAEMIVSVMGLLQSKQSEQRFKKKQHRSFPRILNIVVASGEVGSGTVNACGLRHFNSYLPHGDKMRPGELLEGVSEKDIEVLTIPARDLKTGMAQSCISLEKYLEKTICEAIQEKDQHVILHAVHCSKTGIGIPSRQFMLQMKAKYPDRLIGVVDMAQMRASYQAVREYIKDGLCVLVTGSKFFEGPALAGAVVIPRSMARPFLNMQAEHLPAGFKSYITQYEVDHRLEKLRSMLFSEKNIGLLLRWAASINNMAVFFKTPQHIHEENTKLWVREVRTMIEQFPYIREMAGDMITFPVAEKNALLGQENTIFSLMVLPAKQDGNFGPPLSYNEMKKVHAWMAFDISALLPPTASEYEKEIARQKCLIGQPVPMVEGDNGMAIVRIALGASVLIRLASLTRAGQLLNFDKAKPVFDQDRILLAKLSLIGKYYSYFIYKG